MSVFRRKPLVIYAGGTIGMRPSLNGLVAAPGLADLICGGHLGEEVRVDGSMWCDLDPLKDSAECTPADWGHIANVIRCECERRVADGVLILHGTDTLAYTAAALSFLLMNFQTPVILTGAMIPMGIMCSDAIENIAGSLKCLRSDRPKAGVHVYFHGELMPGTRVSKFADAGRQPFRVARRSPDGIVFQTMSSPDQIRGWSREWSPASVAVLQMHPGMRTDVINYLVDRGVRGIVLECYGSGGAPSGATEFGVALRRATERGVVVVGISQCPEGIVDFGRYHSSEALRNAGVVAGGSLTREAALAKLQFLLGSGLGAAETTAWMPIDLCGEHGNESPR